MQTPPGTAGGSGSVNRIGRDCCGGGAFDGNLSELVVTAGNLSTTNRQKLEGYLAHRWGIAADLPADHPYRAAPPTH